MKLVLFRVQMYFESYCSSSFSAEYDEYEPAVVQYSPVAFQSLCGSSGDIAILEIGAQVPSNVIR